MKDDKLLPCPFCGTTTIDAPKKNRRFGFSWYEVCCGFCSASISDNTKTVAIKAWNRRTDENNGN